MITALFPLPGSKADRKYDRYLYPQIAATAMCEGFQGTAARSIRYNHLPTYLGEINPAQRAIALALQSPNDYIFAYQEALARFWGEDASAKETILSFAGKERSQTVLSADLPELCDRLTKRWQSITKDIYGWMRDPFYSGDRLAGYYACAIRACFGNVMRLNPKGTHFNVTYHVDKLANACDYNPQKWVHELQAIDWNPNVFNCWEGAIAAVPDPSTTYIILDPPYICSDTAKMTPCYPGHQVTTKDGMAETFILATASLKAALERGFSTISVCNYYDPILDAAIQQLTTEAGYSATAHLMGECKALGNSNGRYKHGGRVDKRDRPVEVIYRVEKGRKHLWSGFTVPEKQGEQLNLLELAA